MLLAKLARQVMVVQSQSVKLARMAGLLSRCGVNRDVARRFATMIENDISHVDRVTDVLGLDGLPSVASIKIRGWRTRITPDFPSSVHVEWICEMATAARTSTILAVSINGNEVDRVEVVPIDANKVMHFLVDQSYASVVLAIRNQLYMYKDSSDRFCIFFGDEDVIRDGFGLTDDASDQYFLEWVDDAGLDEAEARYLIGVYETYRAKRT